MGKNPSTTCRNRSLRSIYLRFFKGSFPWGWYRDPMEEEQRFSIWLVVWSYRPFGELRPNHASLPVPPKWWVLKGVHFFFKIKSKICFFDFFPWWFGRCCGFRVQSIRNGLSMATNDDQSERTCRKRKWDRWFLWRNQKVAEDWRNFCVEETLAKPNIRMIGYVL